MISLLITIALASQTAPTEPGASSADRHAEDVRCAGVLSTAQGLLRREDTRRPAVATALAQVRQRLDARVIAGEVEELDLILALQASSNAAATTYEPQIEGCLAVAAGSATR